METYNCIQKTKSSDDCIAETNALLYSIWTDPMKKTQNQASTARNSKQISVDLSNSGRKRFFNFFYIFYIFFFQIFKEKNKDKSISNNFCFDS